jgi:LmbE family N-acetylglucosaminyl deacetylase
LEALVSVRIACEATVPHGTIANTVAAASPPLRYFSRFAGRLLTLGATEVRTGNLGKNAIVFSPHPDDECLGCGGTILRKNQAGATVKLVYMTDGSGSHPGLISKRELKTIRARESRNAAAILGVSGTYFLDFEDSRLGQHGEPAIERVVEILQEERPEEIFVPYRREPVRQAADHVAATDIVLAALRRYPEPVTIWEYPVWFWLHWPWVDVRQEGCPGIKSRHVARNSLRLLFGLRAITELRYSVNISEVLEKKIAALAEHRSQMTQLIPGSGWTTLGHVSRGQFLQRFHFDHEFFRCSRYQSTCASPSSHF